jgi:hypothetical protein
MNFFKLLTFICSIPFIKSYITETKTCANCKFYIPNKKECKKFGNVDIVTGKNTYSSANKVRYNEKDCGKNGKYFEENNLKIITVPYYYVLENKEILFIGSLYLSWFVGFIYWLAILSK